MAPRKTAARPAPARLPAGLQLTDVQRRSWRLGAAVGAGGFGAIHAATALTAGAPASSSGAYVAKLEPHANGPLFTEMHCYHRVARAETIADWQRRRRLAQLGMPRFIANGSVEHAGLRYRFMVMERFGADLQSILDRHHSRLPAATILYIGLQVLDVLEYLHDQEYVHGDVKGQNLLLGLDDEDQIYLVDFGLACRYSVDGKHKPYKPDPKKAHDGTIEFTSRDAHVGVQSRRADLEVLGYNLLQWAAGRLPWQDHLSKPEEVARRKRAAMDDVAALMRACFPAGPPAGVGAVGRYLGAVAALQFEERPNYDGLRAVLRAGLQTLGCGATPRLRLTDKAAGSAAAAGSGHRDRSPLSAIQAPAPEPGGRRRARAAAGGGRRQPGPSAEETAEGEPEEPEEPAAPVRRGRGRHPPKRPRAAAAAAAEKEAAAVVAGGSASTSTSSSIYDNVTPSMQAVLERRAANQQLQQQRTAAAARRAGGSKASSAGRRVRSPVATSGAEESFHTPPTSAADRSRSAAPARRRSGRLSNGGCHPAAAAAATAATSPGRHTAPGSPPPQRRQRRAGRDGAASGAAAAAAAAAGTAAGVRLQVTPRRGIRSAGRWEASGVDTSLSPELLL